MVLVVFGLFVDVPLIVGTFILMLVFRRRIVLAVGKVDVPLLLLFLLVSIPLIIFEEDIDCMPAWCGQVIIPPTLPFILIEMLILGLIVVKLRLRNVFRVVLAFSIFGVGWELTLGGLRGASPLVDLILIPYVALGYAYVSTLPLEVLVRARPPVQSTVEAAPPPPSEPQ